MARKDQPRFVGIRTVATCQRQAEFPADVVRTLPVGKLKVDVAGPTGTCGRQPRNPLGQVTIEPAAFAGRPTGGDPLPRRQALQHSQPGVVQNAPPIQPNLDGVSAAGQRAMCQLGCLRRIIRQDGRNQQSHAFLSHRHGNGHCRPTADTTRRTAFRPTLPVDNAASGLIMAPIPLMPATAGRLSRVMQRFAIGLVLAAAMCCPVLASGPEQADDQAAEHPILQVLADELHYSFEHLVSADGVKPYYLSYTVTESQAITVTAHPGRDHQRHRFASADARCGRAGR